MATISPYEEKANGGRSGVDIKRSPSRETKSNDNFCPVFESGRMLRRLAHTPKKWRRRKPCCSLGAYVEAWKMLRAWQFAYRYSVLLLLWNGIVATPVFSLVIQFTIDMRNMKFCVHIVFPAVLNIVETELNAIASSYYTYKMAPQSYAYCFNQCCLFWPWPRLDCRTIFFVTVFGTQFWLTTYTSYFKINGICCALGVCLTVATVSGAQR